MVLTFEDPDLFFATVSSFIHYGVPHTLVSLSIHCDSNVVTNYKAYQIGFYAALLMAELRKSKAGLPCTLYPSDPFDTLYNSDGRITAVIDHPITKVTFYLHCLSIPEMIDVTECLEWFICRSGIPVAIPTDGFSYDKQQFLDYLNTVTVSGYLPYPKHPLDES